MTETFDLTTALANNIAGQKRTGKHKQFVLLEGPYAIKGPYQQGRLNNVTTRSQIFTHWNTPCVVRAIDQFTTKDGIFIRFPNIMANYQLESEPYVEGFSGLQYRILKNPPVIDIGHAIATNPWIPAEAEDVILALCHCNILGVGDMNPRNTLVDIRTHQFYIIDFDDNLGTDRDDEVFYFNKPPGKKLNWYVRVAQHYNRVADRLQPLLTDPIVLTNKLESRVQRAINLLRNFAPSTGVIKGEVTGAPQTFGPVGLNYITGKMGQIDITPKQPAMIQIPGPVPVIPTRPALQLAPPKEANVICVRVADIRPKYNDLYQWMQDPNNIYIGRRGIIFVTDATGNKIRYPPNDSIWANPFKIAANATREAVIAQYRTYILDKLQKGEITVEQLETLRGKTLGCWCKEGGVDIPCHGDVLVELLELNREGKLFTNTKIPVPVLTPAVTIQRPIGQMVWKGLRGGASKTYSGIDFDVAKSALQKYIRRNMPQKAILAAIELYRLGEVGGDPGVTNMYNRLAIIANEDIGPANNPLVLEVTRLVESGDRDTARLAAMVQLMAESPKTRMMSHAWRAYANPEGRATATQLGLPLDTGFTESDLKYIAENKNSDLFLPSDPENIRPYVLVFLKRLYEKDFNAYSWAYFFLETAKDLTLTKRRKFIQGSARSTTGKPDILLWKALAKILPQQTHDILVDAYYNHSESRPFLQNAVLLALYEVPYSKFDIEPAANIWRQQPVLQEMLDGKYPFEVDAFAIDKHTRKGRQLGKGIQEFVEEGANVIPQDPNYYNSALDQIYKMR